MNEGPLDPALDFKDRNIRNERRIVFKSAEEALEQAKVDAANLNRTLYVNQSSVLGGFRIEIFPVTQAKISGNDKTVYKVTPEGGVEKKGS